MSIDKKGWITKVREKGRVVFFKAKPPTYLLAKKEPKIIPPPQAKSAKLILVKQRPSHKPTTAHKPPNFPSLRNRGG